MTDQTPPPPAGDPPPPGDQPPAGEPPAGNKPPFSDEPLVQPYSHQPVAARVPARGGRGVYSGGQISLDSPKEFVIDFLQGLTKPAQVVARIVMTPQTAAEFAAALRQN